MKNMNKYIMLLFAFCLSLVSCVKENMAGADADGLTSFKAVYADAPTKTVLEGMTPQWIPTDKISVYDGQNNEFANFGQSVSSSAVFKGTLTGKGRKYYLAAYPYAPELTFSFLSKTVYGIIIPTEQTAVENTYDPAAAPAIAYTEDFNLSFKKTSLVITGKFSSFPTKARKCSISK
jgi:hypothetical protein